MVQKSGCLHFIPLNIWLTFCTRGKASSPSLLLAGVIEFASGSSLIVEEAGRLTYN